MNKPLIGIVGSSGTGKSTSLRNLPLKDTIIIDLERKGFPFKEAKNFQTITATILPEIEKAIETATKNADIVVIESFTKYCEILIDVAQKMYKGFDIWNYYNKQIRNTLESLKNEKATVVVTAIDEIVKIMQPTGGEYNTRRIKVQGKVHEGCIEKEFLLVLFTEVRREKDSIEYCFQTNSDGITSAKTPMGMFSDLYIPNDLNTVINSVEEYYA
jgi:molybdopterin-guanine dinucleotide biosynthesis protein